MNVALAAFAALLLSGRAVQVADVCSSVAKADVAAVLGADASDGQPLIPGTCSWNGKGANLSVSRMTLPQAQDAAMIFDARAAASKDETTTSETGIGQRAASSLAANKRTLTLMAVDG